MRVTRLAATLSLVAAALHAGLVDEHLREWWGYGLFFVAASVAQGAYGLVLFALPAQPASWAPADWHRWRRRLFAAGLGGNLVVIALYVVTRTVGVPFAGPAAGEVEPVRGVDLVTKGVELALVACLAWLLRGLGAGRQASAARAHH